MVGTSELNLDGERHRARKTITHDQFDGRYSFSYDIALVALETPIQFNDRAQSIEFSNKVIPENTRLLVSGYGQANSMQEIFVQSISNQECDLKTTEDVHASHLCAESSFGEGICAVSLYLKLFYTKLKLVSLILNLCLGRFW